MVVHLAHPQESSAASATAQARQCSGVLAIHRFTTRSLSIRCVCATLSQNRIAPRPLSFARNETRQPDFRAINQEGKVPTLLIDGRVLTEVAAILFYLARRQGQDHAERIWAMAERRLVAGQGGKQWGKQGGEQWGEWALGAYSIADIHLFRLYWRFAASRGPAPARFPALQAHHDRMLTRPAVQRTIAIEAEIGYQLPA